MCLCEERKFIDKQYGKQKGSTQEGKRLKESQRKPQAVWRGTNGGFSHTHTLLRFAGALPLLNLAPVCFLCYFRIL